MSQHDYVIANGTGAAVRSDLNNALAAIVSQNSGTTEPATMYAYQWWADTTTGLLKIRNAANNAWVTIGSLSTSGFGLLAAGDTLTAALGSASTPGITFTGDLNTGIYSPGADQVAISTNGSGRLFVDASGRVLLNTSTAATGIYTQYPSFQIVGNSAGGANYGAINILRSENSSSITLNENIGKIHFGDQQAGEYATIEVQADGSAGTNDYPGRMVFFTTADAASSPTERMRIDSSGRVGINSTSPQGKLHVNNATNENVVFTSIGSGDQRITALNDAASANVQLSIQASPLLFRRDGGVEVGRWDSSGRLLVGTSTAVANARLESVTTTNSQIPCITYTNASGDLSTPGIRVYKYDNNSTTSQVFVQFAINATSNGCGQINANGTSQAAFGSYSDARLKENVVELGSQWDSFKSLRPVEFDYIESEGGGHQIGFIAQEMQEVFPDLVGERQDGMLTITGMGKNESRLIKALQEAMERIETLEAEVAALKAL